MQKKIVHIITGLKDGGAEGVLYRLCKYNNDVDKTHIVISLNGDGKYRQLLCKCGIQVYLLNMKNTPKLLRELVKLYRILKKENPDIVQTWMYHADLIGGCVAKVARIKTIIWGIRHSDFGKELSWFMRIFIFISAKLSYIIPNTIVSCAGNARKFHINYGYSAKKFIVIHNGYDTKAYYPDIQLRKKTRKNLGITDHEMVVGTVARYNKQKGHSILLNALSELKKRNIKVSCLLVGQGCNDLNQELVEKIHNLGLEDRVKLLDQQNTIIDLMNAMDIHVLPSVSGEGFPNVVAEAMCCGVPCIATNVGDAAEIASDHGLIVEKNNSLELANAIEMLQKEKGSAAWEKRKIQSRNYVIDNFSIEKMVMRFHKLY